MNLQKMMKQAQQMQAKLNEVQAQLAEEQQEGVSGGGLVKVTLNGKTEMKAIAIDASLLKEGEKEMLEDLIIAAFNDAKPKVEDSANEKMSSLAGGLGLPAGMKLPF